MSQTIKNTYHLIQALAANIKHGFPSKDLKIIGVTGTDGKTTCTSMLYHVLKENGFKVAMISTLYAKVEDKVIDTGLHVTTPEPWQLPGILKEMKSNGVEYVILESTSQGLAQNRLFNVQFEASLITNIGKDHLDYHGTWENYANAKFKLIEKTKKEGIAVINKDHKSYDWIKNKFNNDLPKLVEFTKAEVLAFEASIEGLKFTYKGVNFEVPLIGDYNLENCLAVIKICEQYLELNQIANALKTFESPTGRMQVMRKDPNYVIVDFAHTPSSLERALNAMNKVKPKESKIICLYGCAGERDRSRREMGGVSSRLADVTLVSLEDPRTEKIKDINDEIIKSAHTENAKLIYRFKDHSDFNKNSKEVISQVKKAIDDKPLVAFDYDDVQNRLDAIKFGLELLDNKDILFATGKGHEASLAIGNPIVEYPYTDQEAIRKLID